MFFGEFDRGGMYGASNWWRVRRVNRMAETESQDFFSTRDQGAQEKRCNVLKAVQCLYCTVSKNTLFWNTCLYTHIPLISWLNLFPAIWGDNLFYFRSCNKAISFQFKFPLKNEFKNSGCLSLPYVFFVHLENQSFHQCLLRSWGVGMWTSAISTWLGVLFFRPTDFTGWFDFAGRWRIRRGCLRVWRLSTPSF